MIDPSSSRIDRVEQRRRALALALALLALGVGAIRFAVRRPTRASLALGVLGAVLITARFLRPALAARIVAPLDRALGVLGAAVGTAALTLFYVIVFVPYAWVLRRLGALLPFEEPWPPSGTGWAPVQDLAYDQSRTARRALVRRLIVDVGSGAALLRLLARRPSAVLVPVVLVILLFAAGLAIGEVTGLGPLIYSLF